MTLRVGGVLVVAVAASGVAACGRSRSNDDPLLEDAGPTAMPAVEVAAPSPPAVVPCPDGWHEVAVDGLDVPVCSPVADGAPPTCAGGEAFFVGEAGCVEVGPPCPRGRFPEPADLPPGRPVYVDPATALRGDGTEDRPYREIGEALAAAQRGDTLVLARGLYEPLDPIILRDAISLVGACAAETTIATRGLEPGRVETGPGVVTVVGTDVFVGGLTLRGAQIGLRVEPEPGAAAADVTVRGLVVEAAIAAGVQVGFGAEIRGGDLVVRRTAGLPGAPAGAITVMRGSTATLERVTVGASATAGIIVGRQSRATFTRLLVDGTMTHPGTRFGRAVHVAEARVVLSQAWIRASAECGLAVDGAEAAVDGEHIEIAGDADAARGFGCGTYASNGASLTLRRSWIHGTQNHGATATIGPLHLTDVVVSDVRPASGQEITGWGVATSMAPLTLERVAIVRGSGAGISVGGASAMLADVRVVATQAHVASGRGYGVQLDEGASGDLQRVAIEGSLGAGVVAFGAATRLVARDLTVTRTAPGACESCGAGLGAGVAAAAASSVDLERFAVSGATCGVQVVVDASLDARRGRITDNEIGACIQVPGFDVARVSDGVTYSGAGQINVDRADRGTLEPASPGAVSGETLEGGS